MEAVIGKAYVSACVRFNKGFFLLSSSESYFEPSSNPSFFVQIPTPTGSQQVSNFHQSPYVSSSTPTYSNNLHTTSVLPLYPIVPYIPIFSSLVSSVPDTSHNIYAPISNNEANFLSLLFKSYSGLYQIQ